MRGWAISTALFILVSTELLASCRQVTVFGTLEQTSLFRDLSYLASETLQGRETGTQGAQQARQYLQARYRQLGLQLFDGHIDYLQPFTYKNNRQGMNVIGVVTGQIKPERFIVVSAHYDHLGKRGRKIFNGADDNASGVAVMLTLANDVNTHGARHSVIFLASDAEENGLHGAKAFLQHSSVPRTQLVANLNLDMLGQPGRRWRLYATPSRKNKDIATVIDRTKAHAGLCLVRGHRMQRPSFSPAHRIDWHRASDHWAFGRLDIPYLFVGVSDHALYHTEKDTVERIPRAFFIAAAETAVSLFTGLDRINWAH